MFDMSESDVNTGALKYHWVDHFIVMKNDLIGMKHKATGSLQTWWVWREFEVVQCSASSKRVEWLMLYQYQWIWYIYTLLSFFSCMLVQNLLISPHLLIVSYTAELFIKYTRPQLFNHRSQIVLDINSTKRISVRLLPQTDQAAYQAAYCLKVYESLLRAVPARCLK